MKSLIKKIFSTSYSKALVSGYVFMGLNAVVQLGLVPMYLKYLGKEEFGQLMLLFAAINYAAVGIGWMSSGALRVLAERFALRRMVDFSKTYTVSRSLYLAYALLVILLAVAFRLLFDFGHSLSWTSFWLVMLYFFVQYDLAIEKIAFNACDTQDIGNWMQVLSLVLYCVLVVPGLILGLGLSGVISCLLMSAIVARLCSWYARYRRLKLPRCDRLSFQYFRDSCSLFFGKMGWGYLLFGAVILTMQADVVLLGLLGGAEAAADFVLVWKIAEFTLQFIWRLPEFLQPKIISLDATQQADSLKRLYRKSLKPVMIISAVAAVGYGLLGRELVEIWTRVPAPSVDWWVFALAGTSIFWLSLARVPMIFASAMLNFRGLLTLAFLELGLKLILTIALFPRFGIASSLIAVNLIHGLGLAIAYVTMPKFRVK